MREVPPFPEAGTERALTLGFLGFTMSRAYPEDLEHVSLLQRVLWAPRAPG